MALKRPPLFQRGGADCYHLYEAEFDRLYRSDHEIRDVRGLRVVFEAVEGDHPCKHLCFKRPGSAADPYRQLSRVEWSQERAERLAWIGPVLANPLAIRMSHQGTGNLVYLAFVEADPRVTPQADERYLVLVSPRDAETACFLSAWRVHPGPYWEDASRKGTKLWPEPQQPLPKKRRR